MNDSLIIDFPAHYEEKDKEVLAKKVAEMMILIDNIHYKDILNKTTVEDLFYNN